MIPLVSRLEILDSLPRGETGLRQYPGSFVNRPLVGRLAQHFASAASDAPMVPYSDCTTQHWARAYSSVHHDYGARVLITLEGYYAK